MTDYISREAVMDALLHEQYGYLCEDAIRAIPAADVREVVYCKDCRHRDPEDHKCDSGEAERQGCPFKVADDYFCAYGER